jgi:hypothetical protein
MSYQVSPGIEVNEIDNTSTVSGLNSTAAAHVGLFNWGPVLQPTTVTSELNLKELFWKPTDSNAQSWFTAANFLAYSNNLINIRVDAADQYTAVKTPKELLTGTAHFTTGSTAVFGFNGAQFSTLTVGQNLIDSNYNVIGSVASIADNTHLTLNAVPTTTSIPYLTGIITAQAGQAAVTGTGTLFTSELAVGDTVTKLSASSAGYDILGTILSIADDTHLVLAASSAVSAQGVAFGVASTLTGTITSTTGTATVTGVGTNFTEILAIGDVLTTPARVIIGTIASIASNTSLSLTAYGAVAVTGSKYAKGTQTFKDNRVKINNYDDYEANYIEGGLDIGEFAARYPGKLGNSIEVVVVDSGTFQYQSHAGTVTSSTSSKTVTGTGTAFLSTLKVGEVLHKADSSHSVIGVIASIETNTSLTLVNFGKVAASAVAFEVSISSSYTGQFTSAPATSSYAKSKGVLTAKDEIHILVIDKNGAFTGVKGATLEKYSFLSKASDAKYDDGSSSYYKTVINSQSSYVYWLDTPSAISSTGISWDTELADVVEKTQSFKSLNYPLYVELDGGTDASTVTDGEKIIGLDLLSNKDLYNFAFITLGKASSTVAGHAVALAETRKDVIVFISPEDTITGEFIKGTGSSAIDKLIEYRSELPSSSYGFLDTGAKYQYDAYNDKRRWIALNGDIAGLAAITSEPWVSNGGFNNGQIKNVIKLAVNPTKADRDNLYPKGINPVVTFKGQGTVLFGDKTLLDRPSAFDRIGVRRLFILLEKSIEKSAQYQLFAINDDITRAQFKNLIEPFLRDIKGRRGINDFKVVCDTTNNTPNVVETNNFVADIFVKPNYSINYISLNFIATRQSVAFTTTGV